MFWSNLVRFWPNLLLSVEKWPPAVCPRPPRPLGKSATPRNSNMGPSLLYGEFIEFPQWTRNPRPPGPRTFLIKPLKIWFFRLKTPGFFRDFLGDHFARVESSGNPNLTIFISISHVFLNCWPPKIMKIQGFAKPFKTPSPGTMPRW